jgi:hypothetical protein
MWGDICFYEYKLYISIQSNHSLKLNDMRKLLLGCAIALSVGLFCAGSNTAEAMPVEKVKVVKSGGLTLEPISFHQLTLDMPVAIQHDYQATYTYPAPTGVVGSAYAPIRIVEARCNSPTDRR